MTPAEIRDLPRDQRAVATAKEYDAGGYTYDTLARAMLVSSRNVVARLIYDARHKWGYGETENAPAETSAANVGDQGGSDENDGLYTNGAADQTAPIKQHARRVFLRAAVVDIETTDFGTEGFAGYLICVCILPLDADKPTTITIRHDEFGNDKRLLLDVRAALSEYDIIAGHNWSAFDYNWLCSKLMFYGLPPLRTHWIFDTYQAAKTMGIKTRKGLGNLIDYFGLEGVKTTIYRTSWNDIRHPDPRVFDKTLGEIVYHCENDVIANRNLLDVIYPYALSMNTNPFKLSKFKTMNWRENAA